MVLRLGIRLLVAGFLALGAGAAPAAAQTCLSASDARAAVQSGQAISLSQIRTRLSDAAGGEVVSAQLCQSGGRYVYLVNVLSRQGAVKRLTVDAGSGNILNGGSANPNSGNPGY